MRSNSSNKVWLLINVMISPGHTYSKTMSVHTSLHGASKVCNLTRNMKYEKCLWLTLDNQDLIREEEEEIVYD